MKRLLFIAAMLLSMAALSNAQNLNGFFDKYADDERFAYTKIGKEMQTLTLEITSTSKVLAETIEKEILDVLNKDNFEMEISSRDKSERSYIYTKPGTVKGIKETVIINKDKTEINILWTIGKDKKTVINIDGLPAIPDLKELGELKQLKNL